MDSYFVISCSEDGEVSVDQYTKDELLSKVLSPNRPYYGSNVEWLNSIEDNDPQHWDNGKIIIKGSIVTPTVKEVVTKMEIE